MHNGQISDFTLIKRRLQNNLSEELFLHPSGYTGTFRPWTRHADAHLFSL
jgi:predicted glutamine amidotransferase